VSSTQKRIERDIRELYNVNARVRLVEPRSIQRFEGKAKRVIDKRSL